MKNVAYNFLDTKNPQLFPKKEPEQEDNISTTSIEDDTIPDEDFDKNQKHRNIFRNIVVQI